MGKMDKKWVYLCSAAVAAVSRNRLFFYGNRGNKGGHATTSPPQNGSQCGIKQMWMFLIICKPYHYIKMVPLQAWEAIDVDRLKSQLRLKNDKITDVEISHFGMHYSEIDVVGLPDEVLQNQNAQVANVSGATYSTEAFKDAVKMRLSQAQNA